MIVLTADDHELFRFAIRELILKEFEGASVLEAADLDGALERLGAAGHVDLLIVDLDMPGVEGMDSIAALAAAFPDVRLVIMSSFDDWDHVVEGVAIGINGYIPKSLSGTEIVEALRQVMEGRIFVPASVTRTCAAPFGERGRKAALLIENLTERQKQVLDELLLGKSSKEIARSVNISENTVKIHLAAVYRALGVHTRAQAILKIKDAAT